MIGLSRPRENRTFEGLALDERLAREGVGPLCHLAVVNLRTGDVEHRLPIEGVVEELYDVAVLPGVRRPMAIGFKSDEIRFLVRPSHGRMVRHECRAMPKMSTGDLCDVKSTCQGQPMHSAYANQTVGIKR